MKLAMEQGSTSESINVFIQDSSSATGAGLTGLAFNTASLTAYYALPRAAAVAITLATLAAVTTAWTSGGFKEIDATNMPGWYRLDVPNAALAAGRFVSIHLKGAANMAPLPIEISLLTDVNATRVSGDATAGTNLKAAFNDAAGSVPWLGIIDQGTAQAATSTTLQLRAADNFANSELVGAIVYITGGTTGVGQARTITAYAGSTDTATVDAWTTTPTGTITYKIVAAPPASATPPDVNVLNWKGSAAPAMTGDAFARLGAPAGASLSADVAAAKVDTAAIKVQTDKLAFSVTNQLDVNVIDWKGTTAPAMTGDAYARLGAPAGASVSADIATVAGYVDTEVAAIKTQTDKLTFTVANQVDVNVLDWKGATAPAMTGDAYARLGAPAGASIAADIAGISGGGGGLDAAGVRAAVGLASANLDTQLGAIQSDTDNIQTRIPAALVSGRMDASVGAMASNVMTAAAAASDLTTELQAGLATSAALADVATDVDSIKAKTDLIPASPAAVGDIPSAASVATAVWDETVDGTTTARQSVRLANSALAGKASGLATTSVAFRDLADTKDRVSATVDSDGNRATVTLDLS